MKHIGNSKIQYNAYLFECQFIDSLFLLGIIHLVRPQNYPEKSHFLPPDFLPPILQSIFRMERIGCAFHFVEMQSAFCLYLQNELEISSNTLKHFDTPVSKLLTIFALQLAITHYFILLLF